MVELLFGTAGIYLLLILCCSGSDLILGNMTGWNGIFLPISQQTGNFLLLDLVGNIMFSLFLVHAFLKRCNQHMTMRCFEMRAGQRKRLFVSQKKDLYGYWLMAVIGKLLVDLSCMLISPAVERELMWYSLISFALVTLVWMDVLYAFRLWNVGSQISLMVTLALILFSLIILKKSNWMALCAYGMSSARVPDLFIKIVLEIIVFSVGFLAVKKRDLL